MKHAFLAWIPKVFKHLLAYLRKYVCRKGKSSTLVTSRDTTKIVSILKCHRELDTKEIANDKQSNQQSRKRRARKK